MFIEIKSKAVLEMQLPEWLHKLTFITNKTENNNNLITIAQGHMNFESIRPFKLTLIFRKTQLTRDDIDHFYSS